MNGMEWVRESWLDTLALTDDWFNSSEYRDEIERVENVDLSELPF